jgi:hypothetical protein
MPYRIEGLCVQVQKNDAWEDVRCHEDAGRAKQHLAALQMNVEKSMARLTQAETNYTPLSVTDGQACANCRWFSQREAFAACHIVQNFPDEILATGWCNRHEIRAPALPPDPDVAMEERSLWESFKAWWQRWQPGRDPVTSSFKAYGDYWHGAWTNNVRDREGEWISAKAIDAYLHRVDIGMTPLPYLCVWHGGDKARIGEATQMSAIDYNGIVIVSAIGTFDRTPDAQRAKDFYNRTKTPQRMSHGFVYPRAALKERVYHAFNTFELTILPPHRAANAYTAFEV